MFPPPFFLLVSVVPSNKFLSFSRVVPSTEVVGPILKVCRECRNNNRVARDSTKHRKRKGSSTESGGEVTSATRLERCLVCKSVFPKIYHPTRTRHV